MALSMRYRLLCVLGCFFTYIIPSHCDKYAALSGNVTYHTEALDRGRLVGKRSIASHMTGIIYSKKHFAVYGEVEGSFPLQYKERYSDRWKIAGGVLGKITEHFTLDMGCIYYFLERFGFEKLHRWWEWYLGVRSDLLMAPQFYFFLDKERRQWGTELKFHYDFNLFDSDQQWICWENQWGFFKGKYPIGTFKKKYHYMYLGTGFFYKCAVKPCCRFYVGPTLIYNTGGTRSNGIINSATRCSHFCNLSFGLEIEF